MVGLVWFSMEARQPPLEPGACLDGMSAMELLGLTIGFIRISCCLWCNHHPQQNQHLMTNHTMMTITLILMAAITSRAWSGNSNAQATIRRAMEDQPLLRLTRFPQHHHHIVHHVILFAFPLRPHCHCLETRIFFQGDQGAQCRGRSTSSEAFRLTFG